MDNATALRQMREACAGFLAGRWDQYGFRNVAEIVAQLTPTEEKEPQEPVHAATREGTRFALSRVPLRGKADQLVGTDGKQLLVQGGFAFPCAEDAPRCSKKRCGCLRLALA